MHRLSPFKEQLQPLVKAFKHVHPDVLIWTGLGISILTGVLLYSSYEHPWMAVAAVPLLVARLVLGGVCDIILSETPSPHPSAEVLNEVSDRLADIAIFLGLTLSANVDKVLGLLAIIAILMVSFVGILGKAVGSERIYAGILGKVERLVFLIIACLIYGVAPNLSFMGQSVFGVLLILFIPLASLTMLQRLDKILSLLGNRDG